jgi:xylulose-5-phosphate/fructose-6-phosphate phosphoketolase
LATSWHSKKFLNPISDGAVLPVLHLNGYKINNPAVLACISHEELEAPFFGYGYTPYFVEGSEYESMHQAMPATLEHCVLEIRRIQDEARRSGNPSRPRWPMIVLRNPKQHELKRNTRQPRLLVPYRELSLERMGPLFKPSATSGR